MFVKRPRHKRKVDKLFNKIILSSKKLIYKMANKTAVASIIDYAKHKEEGRYKIVFFEFQNADVSCLTNRYISPELKPVAISKQRNAIFQQLLPQNTAFMDRNFHNSFSFPFNQIFEQFQKKASFAKRNFNNSTLNAALDMIEYQLLDFDFISRSRALFKTQYKPDYIFRIFQNEKILQRLWLNSIPSFQAYLPKKVVIVSTHDFDDLDQLTSKLIRCFGLYRDIFLKGNQGSEGRTNVHVRITDSTLFKQSLSQFKHIISRRKFALIETASQIGKSEEKKTISNYRAVCTLIHNEKTHFKMMNIWRSKSLTNISSHHHEQTDYFAENPALSVLQKKNTKIRRLPLKKEKTNIYH